MVIRSVNPFRGSARFSFDDWIVHFVRGLDLDDQFANSDAIRPGIPI
jgi:hypothetical protein